LYLGSDLVAHVKILNTIGQVDRGAYTVFLRLAQIKQIYKHSMSDALSEHVGKTIIVADVQSRSTKFFVDDPPIENQSEAICFLRKSNRFRNSGVGPVYDLASKFVSKLGVSNDGRLYVAGSTTSKMALQLNGVPLRDFQKTILTSDPIASNRLTEVAVQSEDSLTRELLLRRGISSDRQVASYKNSLESGSSRLLDSLKASDSLLAHRNWESYYH